MLLGPGKQRVDLVGGGDTGGAALSCSSLSNKNFSGLPSSLYLNTSVVLKNLTIEEEKNWLTQ